MPYLSYLSVFCPAAPTENASIHGRANTPRETRARGSGAVQGLPACVVASTNRDRAPSLPPPLLSLPPSLSSPAFVIARDIYPTRDIRTHTHIYVYIYVCVYGDRRNKKSRQDISETRFLDRRNRLLPNWSRIERREKDGDETKRVGRRSEATSREEIVAASVKRRRPRDRCGLYLKDGRGSVVRTYVRGSTSCP